MGRAPLYAEDGHGYDILRSFGERAAQPYGRFRRGVPDNDEAYPEHIRADGKDNSGSGFHICAHLVGQGEGQYKGLYQGCGTAHHLRSIRGGNLHRDADKGRNGVRHSRAFLYGRNYIRIYAAPVHVLLLRNVRAEREAAEAPDVYIHGVGDVLERSLDDRQVGRCEQVLYGSEGKRDIQQHQPLLLLPRGGGGVYGDAVHIREKGGIQDLPRSKPRACDGGDDIGGFTRTVYRCGDVAGDVCSIQPKKRQGELPLGAVCAGDNPPY